MLINILINVLINIMITVLINVLINILITLLINILINILIHIRVTMEARDKEGNYVDPLGSVNFTIGVNTQAYRSFRETNERSRVSFTTALNVTRAGVYDLTAAANGLTFFQFPNNLRHNPQRCLYLRM